jgi:uncharacterized protein
MVDKDVLKLVEKAKKDEKVVAVGVFGSSLKGKGRDIDVCLFLDKKYSNIEMSKKKLSYFSKDEIDVQIFQQLPVYIRMQIIKEVEVLFCKDEDFLYELAFDTIKEFGFYKKVYDMYLGEIENG